MFSDLPQVALFGSLFVITLALAVLGDLFILPSLLAAGGKFFHPLGKHAGAHRRPRCRRRTIRPATPRPRLIIPSRAPI